MLDPVPAVIGLVLLLVLSAFFSGSETALSSANRYRLAHLARHGNRAAARVRHLINDRERLLSTILVGNNFANIAASALATTLAIGLAGERGAVYATLVMTVLVLIFAEIAPKTLAARHPERVSFVVSGPIAVLVKLLHPVASAATFLSNISLRLFGHHGAELTVMSEEDLKGMISLGDEDLNIAREKRSMLRGVFSLEDVAIEDIMIPRTKVVAIDIDAPPDDILETIRNSGFTRFPLFRGTLDDIIGVLNSKEIFKYTDRLDELHLEKLARKPLFVPDSAPMQVVLQGFQQQRQHLAIVIDEYGGVEGIVTLEDVLEEIVGEIHDEFDVPRVPQVAELADGALRVAGSCPLAFLNRRYRLGLNSEESSTLAGFVLELTGRIPEVGEKVAYERLHFVIERAEPHRVDQVRIVRDPQPPAPSSPAP
jgi:putative hemolysin